ncbi:MAG: pyridoxamine 5'-phosphate oxidase family protein [Nocardioides sp.]
MLPVELNPEECLELLHANVVGRVAYTSPAGPRIVPLNYAMHRGAIVFRTTPYSELGTYADGSELAFEVDHLDYEHHQGWSVVAEGRGSRVDDPDEVAEIRRTWDPRPWAGGSRLLYVRLDSRTVTGRRLGGDWTFETASPVRRRV